MRAGTLRKRATFQARTPGASGASGERLSSWANVPGASSVPCSLLPRRGVETEEAGGLHERQEMVLRCRSNSKTRAITPRHRVTVDGITYNIRSIVNPDQRDKALEMRVIEGEPE